MLESTDKNISIVLDQADIIRIDKVIKKGGFWNHYIKYKSSNIGIIEMIKMPLLNSKCSNEDIFEIKLEIDMNKDSIIKNPSNIKYILKGENIKKTILGKHILVNTLTGERISINISF